MNLDQLRAIAAIVDEGSFEGAAFVLNVTPSAISQRVRALERTVGHPIVTRTAPCHPTDRGKAVVRLARQVAVLEAEAWQALGKDAHGRTVTSVAVNADALGTWFGGVLEDAANWPETTLDLHVEDQDHTAALLQHGRVIAAVTAEPTSVQGYSVTPLGVTRYVPVVAEALLQRLPTQGQSSIQRLPLVRFNDKDDLPAAAMRASGITDHGPVHYVPSFDGYLHALRAGLGWGMVVDEQLTPAVQCELVRVPGLEDVLVPLYWQSATVPSRQLQRLTETVLRVAGERLEPIDS
ncbi:ArgP/LysG family DNA-binding transcriptional regulator [Gulosibacter bifidus]|uniref:ArgP/LysG family DNA-binding transcriptional regulator n=1 Tax=Gulosibacter bifidus TaxID=272239 RepID=A0ABW5RGU5_9MICO|nr:ArgP/LysG family DNA-binding transcriptional regulator [Gulosibacter bifidus]